MDPARYPKQKVWSLVLAGGRGQRFGRPKQFEQLGDERLVDRVVRISSGVSQGTTLVLPPDVAWDGPKVENTVAGGVSHMASARAGLAAVPMDVSTILIALPSHPLATAGLYRRLLVGLQAPNVAACAPGSALPDALKEVRDGQVVSTRSRDGLMAVPFPAAFDADALRAALSRTIDDLVVDYPEELEAVEMDGGTISIVANEPTNIHITNPEELAMAEVLVPLVDSLAG